MACKIRLRSLNLALIACLLLSGSTAFGYIPLFHVVKSGQHARIETTISGKPMGGVSLEVYRGFGRHGEFPKTEAFLVLTSDQQGGGTLPTLPRGKYLVMARSKPNLEDSLCLNISSNKLSGQTLDLYLTAQPPTFAERLAAAEASTDVSTMSELRGIVSDPIGSPIQKATVDVLIKGTQGKQHALKVHTDANGRFSADLPEGQYLLYVSGQGFSGCYRLVTILRSGNSAELKIKPQIGPSST